MKQCLSLEFVSVPLSRLEKYWVGLVYSLDIYTGLTYSLKLQIQHPFKDSERSYECTASVDLRGLEINYGPNWIKLRCHNFGSAEWKKGFKGSGTCDFWSGYLCSAGRVTRCLCAKTPMGRDHRCVIIKFISNAWVKGILESLGVDFLFKTRLMVGKTITDIISIEMLGLNIS